MCADCTTLRHTAPHCAALRQTVPDCARLHQTTPECASRYPEAECAPAQSQAPRVRGFCVCGSHQALHTSAILLLKSERVFTIISSHFFCPRLQSGTLHPQKSGPLKLSPGSLMLRPQFHSLLLCFVLMVSVTMFLHSLPCLFRCPTHCQAHLVRFPKHCRFLSRATTLRTEPRTLHKPR